MSSWCLRARRRAGRRPLSRFSTHLTHRSRVEIVLATVSASISGLCAGALVSVIHQALADPARRATLGYVFLILCGVIVATRIASEILLMRATQQAVHALRIQLARRLLATPLARLRDMGKPRLLAILTEDIATLSNAVEILPVLFVNSLLLVGCLAYLVWLAGVLVAPLAAFIITGILVFRWLEGLALDDLEGLREEHDVLHRHWRGLVEGTKELKLSRARREFFLESVLAAAAHRLRLRFVRGMSAYAMATGSGALLYYAAIGFGVFVLSAWFERPSEVWLGFTLTLLFMISPLGEAMAALPTLRRAGIALGKIDQLTSDLSEHAVSSTLGRPDEVESTTDVASSKHVLEASPAVPATPPEVELRGVTYQYQGELGEPGFALGPIDLAIRPGETLFIAGGNGSGKSTLAVLITGLVEPDRGALVLDGNAVRGPEALEAFRQNFSAVFADFHLFEELLGVAPTQQSAVHRYLERLGIAQRVRVEHGRFSTLDLSTGQRKRLALVAAYLEDRPIVVFDEWAADQDPVFKRVFYTELIPELRAQGKTVIAITHDDAYFGCADRLVMMESGRVVTDQRRSELAAEANCWNDPAHFVPIRSGAV